jgi:transposase
MSSSPQEHESEKSSRRETLEQLLPEYVKRLSKKGVTRHQVHREYLQEHPDGYRISQFREILLCWERRMNPLMRIEHKAGDRMFIDYAGDKLSLILPDGRRQVVEVFVAIPGCSRLTCVEAVAGQKKEDLIRATENALHYFGGVPQAIVPDNLKSAVTRASRYESVLTEDFSSFAEHYGVTVYPARIYRPRDKAPVENAVKLTCKDIYTRVEQLRCAGIVSL